MAPDYDLVAAYLGDMGEGVKPGSGLPRLRVRYEVAREPHLERHVLGRLARLSHDVRHCILV